MLDALKTFSLSMWLRELVRKKIILLGIFPERMLAHKVDLLLDNDVRVVFLLMILICNMKNHFF